MTVTHSLAEFISHTDASALPEWSTHEAKRTLLNLLAVPHPSRGRASGPYGCPGHTPRGYGWSR